MRRLPIQPSETAYLSARIALEAHGIEFIDCRDSSTQVAGYCGAQALLVENDDYADALAVLDEVEHSEDLPVRDAMRNPWFRLTVNAVVSGLVFLWIALLLHRAG